MLVAASRNRNGLGGCGPNEILGLNAIVTSNFLNAWNRPNLDWSFLGVNEFLQRDNRDEKDG